MVAANLTSVHLVTQAVARGLRDAGRGGAIVNIASIEASNVAPAHSHYAAAKAGVVMYTKSAARELGPLGIRVNAVSPGLIWRPGLDEAWPQGVSAYTAATPLGRLGRFEDVADACLFLVSAARAGSPAPNSSSMAACSPAGRTESGNRARSGIGNDRLVGPARPSRPSPGSGQP